MKFTKLKKLRKRIVASAVATTTALGVLLGGSFDSPTDLLSGSNAPADIVISDTLDIQDGDDINEEGVLPGEEKKKGIRARIRTAVKRLPLAVRAGVGVPLWFGGWLLLGALGFLWEPLLSPLMSALLKAICVAAILAATLVCTVKAVFPDMPVKKILNRKSLFTVSFGALLFGAAGAVMQIFVPEADRLSDIVEGLIMLAALSIAAVPLLKKEVKQRRETLEDRPLTPAEERKMINELAKSVSK